MSRGELDNGEIGIVVLAAPLWLPIAAMFGFVWCVGWAARRLYTIAAAALKEAE